MIKIEPKEQIEGRTIKLYSRHPRLPAVRELFLVASYLLYWLRAGRSGDRIPVGARFAAPAQTGPGAHPASCTMGTWSFPGVNNGRGVTRTPHPLLVPWSRKGRAILVPLLPLWAVRPVQSLSTVLTLGKCCNIRRQDNDSFLRHGFHFGIQKLCFYSMQKKVGKTCR